MSRNQLIGRMQSLESEVRRLRDITTLSVRTEPLELPKNGPQNRFVGDFQDICEEFGSFLQFQLEEKLIPDDTIDSIKYSFKCCGNGVCTVILNKRESSIDVFKQNKNKETFKVSTLNEIKDIINKIFSNDQHQTPAELNIINANRNILKETYEDVKTQDTPGQWINDQNLSIHVYYVTPGHLKNSWKIYIGNDELGTIESKTALDAIMPKIVRNDVVGVCTSFLVYLNENKDLLIKIADQHKNANIRWQNNSLFVANYEIYPGLARRTWYVEKDGTTKGLLDVLELTQIVNALSRDQAFIEHTIQDIFKAQTSKLEI